MAEGDRWNAEVRLLRLFSRDKPCVERVTCFKLTPEHAEHVADIWAHRWVDLHAERRSRPIDHPRVAL